MFRRFEFLLAKLMNEIDNEEPARTICEKMKGEYLRRKMRYVEREKFGRRVGGMGTGGD